MQQTKHNEFHTQFYPRFTTANEFQKKVFQKALLCKRGKKTDYDSINYFKRISFSFEKTLRKLENYKGEIQITWTCIVFNFQLKTCLLQNYKESNHQKKG